MAVGEAEPVCVDGLEVGLGELDGFGGGEWLVWGRFGSVGEQCEQERDGVVEGVQVGLDAEDVACFWGVGSVVGFESDGGF